MNPGKKNSAFFRAPARGAYTCTKNSLLQAIAFAGLLLLSCMPGLCDTTQSLMLSAISNPALVRQRHDMNFDVEYLARDEGWVPEVISRSDAARRLVNAATHDTFLVTIRIVLAPDKASFLKLVGPWAENSVAVAQGESRLVIINGDALRNGPTGALGATLVHELTHLYLAVRCPKPIPRWLNEGIAMNVAGESSVDDSAAVLMARLFRGLIPLSEIEHEFPADADRQRLAYRESYSVVRFLATEPPNGSLSDLIASLTDPNSKSRIAEYWSPLERNAIDVRWRARMNSPGNWIMIIFSSGIFWGLAAGLTVAAWVIVKRRSRALRREWAEEEKIYTALDEEEKKIWGEDDSELPDE